MYCTKYDINIAILVPCAAVLVFQFCPAVVVYILYYSTLCTDVHTQEVMKT